MSDLIPKSISQRRLDKVPNFPERHKPVGFMLRLAKTLHTYGVPTYELEQLMARVADQLNYGIQITAVPTSITMTFMQEEDNPQTYVMRSNSGEVNVDKLQRCMNIAEKVTGGEMNAQDGAQELLNINRAKPIHPNALMIICFSLVSGAIARIFSGGWQEVVAASVIGCIVGLLVNASSRIQTVSSLLPALSAFIAAIVAFAFNKLIGLHSTYIPIVSGIIILVPGMMLTIAMAELATQNLVSGTARLLGAGMIFIQMAFGVAIGSQLASAIFPHPTLDSSQYFLSDWSLWLALVATSLSFTVLFQSRWKEFPWIIVATFSAFFISKWGVNSFGSTTGAFIGALSVGLFANIAHLIKKVPTAAIMMPGFIILVPGSVGFKSLTAILDHDIIGGIEIAFSMIITGISLVTGLLISSIATLPKPKPKKR